MFILTESWAPDTDKIIVQFFECKIPERVFLNGAISICRRFSKVSHRFEAKMCGLSLLAIFTFWVYTLWHTTLVLYSKRKSSITAPGPLTTKLISKQARINATKSVLVNYRITGHLLAPLWMTSMLFAIPRSGLKRKWSGRIFLRVHSFNWPYLEEEYIE